MESADVLDSRPGGWCALCRKQGTVYRLERRLLCRECLDARAEITVRSRTVTPEKKFENDLIRELKKLGVFAHHFDAVGCDGWPDLILLGEERTMLIECKYGTAELRKEQNAFWIELEKKYHWSMVYAVCKNRDGTYLFFDPIHDVWEKQDHITALAKTIKGNML
jgi:hypothetical protein